MQNVPCLSCFELYVFPGGPRVPNRTCGFHLRCCCYIWRRGGGNGLFGNSWIAIRVFQEGGGYSQVPMVMLSVPLIRETVLGSVIQAELIRTPRTPSDLSVCHGWSHALKQFPWLLHTQFSWKFMV